MGSSFVPSPSMRRNRECCGSVKQGHQFARIRLHIQVRIGRKPARHHINRLSDGDGHHSQIESPKLPILLTFAQNGLYRVENRRLFKETGAKLAVCWAKVEDDFPDRQHLQAVGSNVLDVRLDIGAQHQGGRGLRSDRRSLE